jgi:hypothetical protein
LESFQVGGKLIISRAKGGVYIVNSLIYSPSVRVLDISWNSLGSSPTQELIEKFCELLRVEGLVHLDMSYNKFSSEDCEKFAESLKYNHVLMGLHAVGNAAKMDTLGFMHAVQED